MQDEEKEKLSVNLPENAFRELKDGEKYEPILRPECQYPEVTPYSVSMGLIMAVIFSAAAAYLGLKVGQVFEAAIPIAIIAVGLSSAMKRKNALGENVIVQSIGASSGIVVAGAIFTLPALYILKAKYPEIAVSFLEIFLSSLLGGVLGILFFIPFRKYFVSDMHGKFPFPEATATTQVLVSGEKGGDQAKPLIMAGIIGGLYEFVLSTFSWWSETLSTRAIPALSALADKTKMVFGINTGSAVLGLGFIVGLKYSFIIFAGSAFIWWVIVPIMGMSPDMAAIAPEDIFKNYARYIGIGGIAMAGIIGVVKSRGVIKSAFGLMGKVFKGGDNTTEEVRTQRDLPMKIIAIGALLTLVVTTIFFYFDVMQGSLLFTLVGIVIVAVIAFLFTTVAANAIAIVGSNPVSGMTLMTLILSSIIMVVVGLKGTGGMVAALIMGGVVCTALSSAGAFITDLKIGYWLGATPQKQETFKFLGILVSAATVGGVIMILNKIHGFTPDNADVMAAPQARAMALVLNACGISALAFALGMFIPLQLNLPLMVGGLASWYVNTRSTDATTNSLRNERGTLLASGFIAGGALMGVASTGLQFFGINLVQTAWLAQPAAEWLSLVMYVLLTVYLVRASISAKR